MATPKRVPEFVERIAIGPEREWLRLEPLPEREWRLREIEMWRLELVGVWMCNTCQTEGEGYCCGAPRSLVGDTKSEDDLVAVICAPPTIERDRTMVEKEHAALDDARAALSRLALVLGAPDEERAEALRLVEGMAARWAGAPVRPPGKRARGQQRNPGAVARDVAYVELRRRMGATRAAEAVCRALDDADLQTQLKAIGRALEHVGDYGPRIEIKT